MENSILNNNPQMPRQKLSISKKTDTWRRSCIDAAISMIGLYSSSRRTTRSQKQRNYNLANGKLDMGDLEYAVNPLGIDIADMTFPATIQPYDIWTPIFQELFGEEALRPSTTIVSAVNEEAISAKEEKRKQFIVQRLKDLLSSNEDIAEQLTAIEKGAMSLKDMREHIGSQTLTYLKQYLRTDKIFQKGWEDALISSEEIYAAEVVSNEPKLRNVNPMELHFILPHNSDLIDDAEIIVEETYMSVSQIVDNFYETLKPAEINALESGLLTGDKHSYSAEDIVFYEKGFTPEFAEAGSPIHDSKGNIKVCKVTWKSKKKVGILRFLDDNNEQQETIVSEEYPPQQGESVEWLWINEYWEGYKIGQDLYKNIRPKKLQFRHMDNISVCKSGYVGSVYNCNNAQAVSLMDRLVPFIYLYIIGWYRAEHALAIHHGRLGQIDLSLIPDGWGVEKWFYYVQTMGFSFVNSFNEGKKGQAQGKLAGNYNQTRELNLEMGNYIQQHLSLLQVIEDKLKHLAGVPQQRLGNIKASELVGNTERAVTQASYVTEKWFQVHSYNKERALNALLETAQSVWSEGKSKKLQYISDDLLPIILELDTDLYSNTEYAVMVSNSAKDQNALNSIKGLMQAAIQNDKADLSTMVSILKSESIADMSRQLKQIDDDNSKRQQQQVQAELQSQEKINQDKINLEIEKLDREDKNKELDRENDLRVAEIKAMGFAKDTDVNDNNIPDVLEIERLRHTKKLDEEKLELERQKMTQDKTEAEKDREHALKLERIKSKNKPKTSTKK